MKNRFMKMCSILLVVVLLFNMLPHRALADMLSGEEPSLTPGSIAAGGLQDVSETITEDALTQETNITEAKVVGEAIEKRTEFSKEFRLSNGLHMAAVYDSPVHYKDNGQWKEIDNTLNAKADGTVTNTAGVWNISFPQQLSVGKYVTVRKDGYTLRFGMGGVLSDSGMSVMRAGNTFSVQQAQTSAAQVQQLDATTKLTEAKHPETVATKLNARLQYSNVYSNTNVVYDLQSNKLKESVVINRYDSSLRGYRYTLDVGKLVPVLQEDNSILFYDETRRNVVMTMPAPFMVDADKAYNYDVEVVLEGSGSSYTLQYILPQQWLAAEERAWPVVLDPVVTPATNASNIQDVTVAQNATVSHTSEILQCGYNSTWGKHRFLVKFNELPRVTSSDVIVGAEIGLYMLGGSSDSHPVEVHKVNSVWQASSLTWSSAPGIQETSEDFVIASQPGLYYWDVTNIVRDWYNGPNTGMLFKITTAAENAQAAWTKQFCASDYSPDSTMIPSLTVYFRNGNGQEGYWGYTSSSAGRAGTGYVNNFTGNLTWVREDMGFGGNRMPVSISHIYNLNDAVSPADSNNANDTNGNAFGLGVGWRTNFNQRIFFWQVETEYIGWEDGDGTDHYFRYDSGTGKYKDEDGLNLIFSTDGGGSEPYYITDKQGNRSYFDAYGRLTKQINNQATQSCIEIVYDGLSYRIATITDGAGRVYSFSYTNNLLNNITYLDSLDEPLQTVSFAYEGGKLTRITDADNRSCKYTYTSAGVLTTAQDIDDYTLTYSYNSPTQSYQPYRVLQVAESDYSEMEQREAYGGAKTFDYDYNQTKITDHNGNVQVIQFNNYGDVTAVYDDDGRGQFSRYSTDTDPNGTPHQLKSASDLQNTVVNLLKNSNFRRYDIEGVWSVGAHTPSFEVSDLQGYRSGTSLKVDALVGNSVVTGPTYPVNKGETITFSAYIKSDNASVQLAISEVSTSGTANCIKSDAFDYADNIDYDPEDNWRRIEVSYTNNTAVQKNIRPQIIAVDDGCFYVDCVQLEYAVSASRYNWIDNGDFRLPNVISSSGYSTYWSSSGTRAESADTGAPQLDENVWEFSGLYNGKYRSYQDVYVTGDMYDTFVLAGWGKGNATPSTVFADSEYQPSSDRFFGIKAKFNYTDGTRSEEMGIAFNSGVDAWQYGAAQITAEKAYKSISVYLVYDHGAGTVYFDGIQLFYGFTGTTYTYDQNNNPKTVTDPIGNTTTYTYDQQTNNLICEIGPDGTKTEYWYDSYHNLVRKKVSLPAGEGEFEPDTEYSYTYDEYGNQLSVVFSSCPPEGSTEERKWTSETYTYSSDGNRLLRTTDTLGNVTEYDYDPETGLLMWVMDPEGNYTEYSYNNMFQLKRTGVDMGTDGTASVGYSYDGNDLASISTATTQYNIEYCELFGLRQRIHIDESSIVFYYYTDDENHYLSGIDFCNGSEVYYTYDEKGRRIKEEFSEGDTVDSVYNSNGNLSQVKDSQSGITTNYYYDDNGRNSRYTEKAQGYDHEVAYSYNGMGDISAVVEKIGTDKFAGSYDYDELNRVERYSYADIDDYTINVDVEYVYDRLGRVTTKYTKNNGTTVLTESYTYVQPTGGAGKTSSQIATYTTTAANGYSVTYSYTYDDNGNILSISDGSYITSYAYDNLNQLVRENNEAGGYTYVWDYDKSGNILSRTKYNYTTGTLGAAITAADYCYGDSYWGDLMTSYDGMYVEYEGTGNLIFYGNDFYSWEHGHELVAITSDIEETEWNFSYNADGMRIQRSGDGKTYKYVYNGGQLSQMTVGGNTLNFSYDADGTPLTVIYNGTTYYYATNLQGDVVAILNSAGTAVVRYTYDSWGNILATTGSMSPTLGFQNPLRYRGYVYDEETGLYYLQSRYYNPEWGRFLSAEPNYIWGEFDEGAGLLAYNLFAYCANNPVMFKDVNGESITLACVLICAGIGLLAGGGIGAYSASKKGYSPSDGWKYWKYVVGYGVVGGSVGALVGWGAGTLIAKYGVSTAATSIAKGGGARFSSFSALKRSLGSAGKGFDWHHIVEQCQISKSGFSKYWIQNSNNVVRISKSVHTKVTAYYNQVHSFTNGMKFRNWLAGQDFKTQYEWGIKVLKMYGVKF